MGDKEFDTIAVLIAYTGLMMAMISNSMVFAISFGSILIACSIKNIKEK